MIFLPRGVLYPINNPNLLLWTEGYRSIFGRMWNLCKFSKYVVLLFYIWLRMYRRYMDKFAICEWNLGELADLYLNLSGPILQCMAWSWPAPLSGIRFIDKTGWGLVYLTHHSRRHTPCFVLFGASSFLDRSTSLWFSKRVLASSRISAPRMSPPASTLDLFLR